MMASMDWATVGTLAGLMAAGFGYLTHVMHREIDRLRDEVVPRLDRLEERYIRHLEQHAAGR